MARQSRFWFFRARARARAGFKANETRIAMAKQCMRCYVTGKVQGVWFRASTKEQAKELEITGWAKNLPDGRVEVMACGEDYLLDILFDWLKHGPPLAQVSECTREPLDWADLSGFEIM